MPLIAPRRYCVAFPLSGDRATGHNPADSTTYYFGWFGHINPFTSSAQNYGYMVMVPGTLIGARIKVVAAVPASGESATFYVRINNTTDVTLSSAVTMSSSSQTFDITGLSAALAYGDVLECKFTTPAWVTNPTAASYQLELLIQEAAGA